MPEERHTAFPHSRPPDDSSARRSARATISMLGFAWVGSPPTYACRRQRASQSDSPGQYVMISVAASMIRKNGTAARTSVITGWRKRALAM